ncbi:MAG: hypothetical protein FWB98_04615 [Defluviitaleaceae bacterium]|nr:hypothetical protein [Defluviitaleaceae bacterium]
MRLNEYLLSIEGTEDEGKLFEALEKTGESEEELAAMTQIPVAGKLFIALSELYEIGSIAEFKQTPHFDECNNWSAKIDFDKDTFMLYPGPEMRKKIFIALGIFVGAIVGLVMLIKFLRRR